MSKDKNNSKIKKFFIALISCIVILLIVVFSYIALNYTSTIIKNNSYIKDISVSSDISASTINTANLISIYSDLKNQGYTSFIYGFELNGNQTLYKNGDDLTVIINLSSNDLLKNKIINIYSYDKSTGIFKCLGEVKSSDTDIKFKVNSLGEYFITLSNAPTYDVKNEKLIYNEEFNSNTPISNDWTYDIGNNDGWGNKEEEYYTNSSNNSNISNGTLNITALKENKDGYNYTSARLVSKNSYLYGKFEICAELPQGDGTWPAIWLLAANNAYGNWPDSGEIDIMEAIGREPGYIRGSLQMNAYNFKKNNQKTQSIKVNDLYSSYHVYEVLWTPNKIELSVDGHVYLTYYRNVYDIGPNSWQAWPYNKAFNLLLNVAIGGTYGGTVDNNIFPQTMKIKYIKIYDLNLNDYNLNSVTS